MKIHEYQAAEIFTQAGLPVPPGVITTTPQEAVDFAHQNGYPVVLKAQVLVGGRGKAGGIKVVHSEDELKQQYNEIQELVIKDYKVKKIFVKQCIDIQKEFYCAITIDPTKDDVVIIASAEGGVEIEETAKTNPDAIKKYYLQGKKTIDEGRWNDFISSIFDTEPLQKQGTEIFKKMLTIFFENDCSLVEINPLTIDSDGEISAVDAKMSFDENALGRHERLEELRDLDYEDPDEMEAKENNLSFVKLEGNVGCIVNGAGLAMATMDIVKLLGGEPANFLDVGGSSNPEKVGHALRIILKDKKVKAILINIFGGITRCDDIANGILEAKKKMDLPVPLVVRLTGTNEKEAKAILADNGLETFSTMRDAVNKAVELANQ